MRSGPSRELYISVLMALELAFALSEVGWSPVAARESLEIGCQGISSLAYVSPAHPRSSGSRTAQREDSWDFSIIGAPNPRPFL